MKNIVVLTALLVVTQIVVGEECSNFNGEPDRENGTYFYYLNDKGELVIEDLTVEADMLATSSEVSYYFFNRQYAYKGIKFKHNEISKLRNTSFDVSKDTLFIIHGWQNSHLSEVSVIIRQEAIEARDLNVIVVDWSPISHRPYVAAKSLVVRVGNYVAEVIETLVKEYGLKLSNVTFAGHSLGAHVAGNAGDALKGKVDLIIGLDPAGPLFTSRHTDDRLDRTDAQFVQIIHTNSANLGFDAALGHSDYYPNGGNTQPGCGPQVVGVCSHLKSYRYYAESLRSRDFVAKKCDSYRDYNKKRCDNAESSVMGTLDVDRRAYGNYYLKTNHFSPYAQGE